MPDNMAEMGSRMGQRADDMKEAASGKASEIAGKAKEYAGRYASQAKEYAQIWLALGAIVGGLMGARLGLGAIPDHLAQSVVGSHKLRALAIRYAQLIGNVGSL